MIDTRILVLLIVLYISTSVNGKLFGSSRRSGKVAGKSIIGDDLESPTLIHAPYDPKTAIAVDSMNSIDEVREEMEYFGNILLNYSKSSLFLRGVVAGIFVGFGGILTASCGFDAGRLPWESGNGLLRFVSGAVGFPLTILLVSMTGFGAWTGDMLLVARAYFSKSKEKVDLQSVIRMSWLTWSGALVGTMLMAILATIADLPCLKATIAIADHKLSFTFVQTFIRYIQLY